MSAFTELLAELRDRAQCLKPGLGYGPTATEILDLIIALIDAIDHKADR